MKRKYTGFTVKPPKRAAVVPKTAYAKGRMRTSAIAVLQSLGYVYAGGGCWSNDGGVTDRTDRTFVHRPVRTSISGNEMPTERGKAIALIRKRIGADAHRQVKR